MSNAFNSANYPNEVEPFLQKGDYWAWKRTDLSNDYPVALYSLKYKFHLISGSTAASFIVNATESNNEYLFALASTSSQTAGDYKWTAIVTNAASVSAIVNEGYVTIVDDGLRSHVKIVLDSIEAVVEGRANMDQSSMSIAGRSLSRMSIDELLTFRDRYKVEWLKEVKLARVKNGNPSGNTIGVQF